MPLSPTFPDLVSLDLFASVVDLGSVSRAAAAHGISQPSASARIAGLEQRLGIDLLHRAPGGSVPTEEGALVADWVGQLLAAADDLDAALAALRSKKGRRVRVSATRTVAEFLLPGWLVGIRDRYPATPVELEATEAAEVVARVKDGRSDLGFVESAVPAAGLSSAGVGVDRLVVVVDPDHPWARRRGRLGAGVLADTPLLAPGPGHPSRVALEEALRRVNLKLVAPAAELDQTAALKGAAIAGQGPAVLSRSAVEPDVLAGRLVVVEVDGVDLERRLRALWSPSRAPVGPAADLLAVARRAARAA
jgi:DNA-binding transcriptional LysR family regulator